MSRNTYVTCMLSPRLCFFVMLNWYLFVYRDDSLTSSIDGYHAIRTTNLIFCTSETESEEVGPVKPYFKPPTPQPR